MIVALAGRRIDEKGTDPPRFPLRNVSVVRERIRDLFLEEEVNGLICSGACGADLIALELSIEMYFGARMILPFNQRSFLKTSVEDRPGQWQYSFRRVHRELKRRGEVVNLGFDVEDPTAYAKTGSALLDAAQEFEKGKFPEEVSVVVVWDGTPWGKEDATALFRDEATERNMKIFSVSTLV